MFGRDGELGEAFAMVTSTKEHLRNCMETTGLKIGVQVLSGQKQTEQRHRKSDSQEILQWLSSVDHQADHAKRRERINHRANTGDWLLKSQEFLEWRDGTKSHRLWYLGKRICPTFYATPY